MRQLLKSGKASSEKLLSEEMPAVMSTKLKQSWQEAADKLQEV